MTWTLPDEAFALLERRFQPRSRVLELGSGAGTLRLSRSFEVTSIEHDPDYLNKTAGVTYIHAPLVTGWYDPEAVKDALDRHPFDVAIVDGPPGDLRLGLLFHVGLFPPSLPMLFDDTHRRIDRRVAEAFARRRAARIRTYRCRGGARAFSTVGF